MDKYILHIKCSNKDSSASFNTKNEALNYAMNNIFLTLGDGDGENGGRGSLWNVAPEIYKCLESYDTYCYADMKWNIEHIHEDDVIRYRWIAHSDDGCFTDESKRIFLSQEEAYDDMRHNAVIKILWNTSWDDVIEDSETYNKNGITCSSGELNGNGYNVGDNCGISYKIQFHPNMIQHHSYSGLYTWKIERC